MLVILFLLRVLCVVVLWVLALRVVSGVKEQKISSRSSSDLELLVNKERASMAGKVGNHCAQCD